MVVNNIATDQFTDHGANQNIGWEVIQAADTRKANGCCEPIRAKNNERLVVILAGHDCGQSECACGMTRRKRLIVRQVGPSAICCELQRLDNQCRIQFGLPSEASSFRRVIVMADNAKKPRCTRYGVGCNVADTRDDV